MPVLHRGLAEPPAQEHAPAVHLARKVDQTDPPVLELDAERIELALELVDVARDGLDLPLQGGGAGVGVIGTHAGAQQIQLDDRLLPARVRAHDVLDDPPDERQRAIRVIDGEELHAGI